MSDDRFPKAAGFTVKWLGIPKRIGTIKRRWLMYSRLGNAARLVVLPFVISWRMPWLPSAAFALGWNAHFRQCMDTKAAQTCRDKCKEQG